MNLETMGHRNPRRKNPSRGRDGKGSCGGTRKFDGRGRKNPPASGDLRIVRSEVRPGRYELHMADIIPAARRVGWLYADEFDTLEEARAAAEDLDPEAPLTIENPGSGRQVKANKTHCVHLEGPYQPGCGKRKAVSRKITRGVKSSSQKGRKSLANFLFRTLSASKKSKRVNPPKSLDFPPEYVVDPYKPIPKSYSKAKRQRIAELREAYSYAMGKRFARKTLRVPEAVAELLEPLMGPLETETRVAIPLDVGARAISEPLTLTKGDVDGTDASPRTVLRAMLQAGAVSFILAHNHPSGSATPSAGDLAVTKNILKAATTVGVPLLDHVIIGNNTFTSIRRNNPELWHMANPGPKTKRNGAMKTFQAKRPNEKIKVLASILVDEGHHTITKPEATKALRELGLPESYAVSLMQEVSKRGLPVKYTRKVKGKTIVDLRKRNPSNLRSYRVYIGDLKGNAATKIKKGALIGAESAQEAAYQYLQLSSSRTLGSKLRTGKTLHVHVWDTKHKWANGMPKSIKTFTIAKAENKKKSRKNPSKSHTGGNKSIADKARTALHAAGVKGSKTHFKGKASEHTYKIWSISSKGPKTILTIHIPSVGRRQKILNTIRNRAGLRAQWIDESSKGAGLNRWVKYRLTSSK